MVGTKGEARGARHHAVPKIRALPGSLLLQFEGIIPAAGRKGSSALALNVFFPACHGGFNGAAEA